MANLINTILKIFKEASIYLIAYINGKQSQELKQYKDRENAGKKVRAIRDRVANDTNLKRMLDDKITRE